MNLDEFLAQKPLYYNEIDYTRMPRAYESIKDKITIPKVIHVVGTNGKGTTGRFIANALVALGFKTGHYTSPHIFKFNERIWIDGDNIDDETLEKAHQRLLDILPSEFLKSLSYFEYTTFLAMVVYERCDYVVLEAGLGGEHDATNVFEKLLSVITPIGLDHEEFLGNSIEEIAATKLRSVSTKAIVSEQKFKEVFETAKQLEEGSNIHFVSYKELIDQDMITISEEVTQEFQMPHYLQENLLLSMAVIKELGFEVEKKLFEYKPLQGRMQRIKPNVWLDLGHNSLAAEAISHCFCKKSVNLVYNSYKDKDYMSILRLLEPIVKKVEIIPVESSRVASRDDLVSAIIENGLEYKTFEGVKEDEYYLVFGSFSVAEAFTKFY
jgi:dihydrofolate synthase/folylpolyglutamate synthase